MSRLSPTTSKREESTSLTMQQVVLSQLLVLLPHPNHAKELAILESAQAWLPKKLSLKLVLNLRP
jgi:hypothetical protein